MSKARPDIVITSSTNTTLQSDSVSYEHFEVGQSKNEVFFRPIAKSCSTSWQNFFETNTPNRSSLMPGRAGAAAAGAAAGTRPNTRRQFRNHGIQQLNATGNPLSTPSKITFRNPAASSTMLATTVRSPGPGNTTASGKKLMSTAKNCPIIF